MDDGPLPVWDGSWDRYEDGGCLRCGHPGADHYFADDGGFCDYGITTTKSCDCVGFLDDLPDGEVRA